MSITGPMNEALIISNRLTKGDLSVKIKTDRKDETGQLLTAMGNMVEKLRGIVKEVRRSSDYVASGSEQLSSSAEMMSHGASEQAEKGIQHDTAVLIEDTVKNINEGAEPVKITESSFQKLPASAVKMSGLVAEIAGLRKFRWCRYCCNCNKISHNLLVKFPGNVI